MESIKNGDKIDQNKQANLMKKIKDLMDKKKAEVESESSDLESDHDEKSCESKDIDNLKNKIEMMNKNSDSIEKSNTKNEISQLIMYFVQNPQQLNVMIDRLQGMVDNVTDKFDPTNFFKRRKPYDMKKGYIIMNLVLKYMDLLELMECKYDENISLKCQNGLLYLSVDGEYFNNHLNKLWSMIKLILVEVSQLKIDGLKASVPYCDDIKFESPQLFVQPQKSYQDILESIGFKQNDEGSLDLDKICYPEDVKNLIIDSIYSAQIGTIIALRNHLNNKYMDLVTLVKNSFFSGSTGVKYLTFWETVNTTLSTNVTSQILYLLTSNSTVRSVLVGFINNATIVADFNGINFTAAGLGSYITLFAPFTAAEIINIRSVIEAEEDLTLALTFKKFYDAVMSIEKIAYQFTNIFMKKNCPNGINIINYVYTLVFKYSDTTTGNIISNDKASKIVGSLYVSENIELAGGEKNLMMSIIRKTIETMDLSDFNTPVFDPNDILSKVKSYRKVALKLPYMLSNPIQDMNIDLIDDKFCINRTLFIDTVKNNIFECYGDILKNFYCTSDKDEYAESIFLKADNLVLESRRIKLIKFLKQFKSDINLSISFFYKVAETYNATVRPENLAGCPAILQNKPQPVLTPAQPCTTQSQQSQPPSCTPQFTTPQFHFPTPPSNNDPCSDTKCEPKCEDGSKFYSGSKTKYC